MLLPLTETKAFQLMSTPTAQGFGKGGKAFGKAAPATASEKPAPKKGRKAQKSPAPATRPEVLSATITSADGETRAAIYADDIINTIQYSIELVPPEDIDQVVVQKAYRMSVQFALVGPMVCSVGKPGKEKLKTIKAWLTMRKLVRTILADAHPHDGRPLSGEEDSDEKQEHDADVEETAGPQTALSEEALGDLVPHVGKRSIGKRAALGALNLKT